MAQYPAGQSQRAAGVRIPVHEIPAGVYPREGGDGNDAPILSSALARVETWT